MNFEKLVDWFDNNVIKTIDKNFVPFFVAVLGLAALVGTSAIGIVMLLIAFGLWWYLTTKEKQEYEFMDIEICPQKQEYEFVDIEICPHCNSGDLRVKQRKPYKRLLCKSCNKSFKSESSVHTQYARAFKED